MRIWVWEGMRIRFINVYLRKYTFVYVFVVERQVIRNLLSDILLTLIHSKSLVLNDE